MKIARPYSSSAYMEFAKLHSTARFNLATSGVEGYPLRELPVRIEDLEINAPMLYGYAPLQERLARLNGVEPDCVVHTVGTSLANHLAMAALLAPGDEVLIEEPVYELLLSTALFLGARVKRFQRRAERGYGIDCDEVRHNLTPRTRLIVLTNLHNPTSAFADQRSLKILGEMALQQDAHVLVDEVYLETLYRQYTSSVFHLGEPFVVTSSLTKAYGLGGLRCGWILAQPELAQQIWRLNDLFGASHVHPAERLSVAALDHLEKIATRAEALIGANRKALRDIAPELEQHLDLMIPEAGSTIFPRLMRGKVENFCQFLHEKFETSVVPGCFFERPEHFRIGLGGNPAMTKEGLSRLAEALQEWKG